MPHDLIGICWSELEQNTEASAEANQLATSAPPSEPTAETSTQSRDAFFMQYALLMAQKAYDQGEVPVGSVLVYQNTIIAAGYNQPITLHDPTAHAEMMALRQAGQAMRNYRLPECELFVTLEPCIMCAGAMMHARIQRVVFATHDPKTGVVESMMRVFDIHQLNHHTQWTAGVLAAQAKWLLQRFFAERRAAQKGLKALKRLEDIGFIGEGF